MVFLFVDKLNSIKHYHFDIMLFIIVISAIKKVNFG